MIWSTFTTNNNNDGKWAIYNTNFSEKDESRYLIVINHKKISNKVDLSKFKILHNFNDYFFLEKMIELTNISFFYHFCNGLFLPLNIFEEKIFQRSKCFR